MVSLFLEYKHFRYLIGTPLFEIGRDELEDKFCSIDGFPDVYEM